jgi:hypothetical protein
MNPSNALEGPPGVLTVTVRDPTGAPVATVIATGRFVLSAPPVRTPDTPVPLNATPVAALRFTPTITAAIVEPVSPTLGLIDVIVGAVVAVTANPSNGAEILSDVASVSDRGPGAAVLAIEIVTGRLVVVAAPETFAVTPAPLNTTEVTPARFVPDITAATVVACAADKTLIDVIPGVLGSTVNPPNGVDSPFGVVTVTFLKPVEAFGAIVSVTGKLVSEPTEISAETPAPSNVTEVAPVRFVPLKVAPNVAPCAAEDGLIEVTRGVLATFTVNPLNPGEMLPRVMMYIVLKPGGAAGSIVIVTGMLVSVPPLEITALTPVPVSVTDAAPLR